MTFIYFFFEDFSIFCVFLTLARAVIYFWPSLNNVPLLGEELLLLGELPIQSINQSINFWKCYQQNSLKLTLKRKPCKSKEMPQF